MQVDHSLQSVHCKQNMYPVYVNPLATLQAYVHKYGTRSKKVNVLRVYYTYGYGRTTTMATGVLRLRLWAYGYGRATLTATGVLV